jgi:restriction system protein
MPARSDAALKLSDRTLFAVLLRSPWWISFAIAAALVLLAMALLPEGYRLIGTVSGLPFIVIGAMAAYRQRGLPGAAQVARTVEAVSEMPWPGFAALLEAAFRRDGYTVSRATSEAFDFELERNGRRMLVSARRWKAARTGIEPLRALQAARQTSGAADALYVCIREISDNARPFAVTHGIAIWQGEEVARAVHGLPMPRRG